MGAVVFERCSTNEPSQQSFCRRHQDKKSSSHLIEAVSRGSERVSSPGKIHAHTKHVVFTDIMLLFQLSNTELAYQQSKLSKRMAEETTLHVELAHKADHQNKAIFIFTVTFLPLSFFTSLFGYVFSLRTETRDPVVHCCHTDTFSGMDPSNIQKSSQGLFWAVSGPISCTIISFAMIFAFRSDLGQLFSRPATRR